MGFSVSLIAAALAMPAILPASAQVVPLPMSAPKPADVARPGPGEVAVRLDTSAGPLTLAIDTAHAPVTAKNFLQYVDTGRLDGRSFYRIVKVQDEFGFVQFGMNGDPKLSFEPIAHEPTTETGVHHVDGTISIARLEPGSARGEFTIVVGDNRASFDAHPEKPGDNLGYAAFGHLVAGRDTLIAILDTPTDPSKTTDQGAFKGQMPADPVTIIDAERVAENAPPVTDAPKPSAR